MFRMGVHYAKKPYSYRYHSHCFGPDLAHAFKMADWPFAR
jgi:hypothetical protein